jgi:hypothetical protein
MTSINLRRVFRALFYITAFPVTAPFRVRKLERQFALLRRDSQELARKFNLTVAFYEQRLETLAELYARRLATRADGGQVDEHSPSFALPDRQRHNRGSKANP